MSALACRASKCGSSSMATTARVDNNAAIVDPARRRPCDPQRLLDRSHHGLWHQHDFRTRERRPHRQRHRISLPRRRIGQPTWSDERRRSYPDGRVPPAVAIPSIPPGSSPVTIARSFRASGASPSRSMATIPSSGAKMNSVPGSSASNTATATASSDGRSAILASAAGRRGIVALRPMQWQNYVDHVAAVTQSKITADGLRNVRRLF